jgi:hypothetical protein
VIINNHIADRWHFYSNKVPFPYVRQVGVKGETVTYEVGEEELFLDFLRTKKATLLWADSEELQAISNLNQMMIKVITTKGKMDKNPTVKWVGTDPDLSEYKILPEGKVSEMVLIHYEDKHNNLVVDWGQ